jgi:hypothetical protein
MERLTVKGNVIIGVYYSSGQEVILTDKTTVVNKQHLAFNQSSRVVGFTNKFNHVIIGYLEKDQVKLYNASTREEIKVHNTAEALIESGGRIYLLSGGNVMEMQFMEMTNQVIAAPKIVAQVMAQATQAYEGVIIQNILGSYFANIFPATNTAYQIRLPELDDYKVIEAKYENHVLMVMGYKKGKYDRLIFRMDKDFDKHDCRTIEDVQMTGLNFTVLDKGVCAVLNEDDTLEIFHIQPFSKHVTQIKDKELDGDVQLFHDGIQTLAAKGDKLYTINMRK